MRRRCKGSRLAEDLRLLGNDEFKANNYQAAIKLYSDAIEQCHHSAVYYSNRAACYMMLLNYRKALKDSRKAIQIDPQLEKSYARVLKCCMALGDVFEAERTIEDLNMELIYPSFELTAIIRRCEYFCQQFREIENIIEMNIGDMNLHYILKCLNQALEISPACIKYMVHKAEVLVRIGRTAEALAIADGMIKVDCKSADAFYIRGFCSYFSDNIEKCFPHFEKALDLDFDHDYAKILLFRCKMFNEKKECGNRLFKSRRYYEAKEVYTDALYIDPRNPFMNSKLFFNRALMNSKMENLHDAIVDCSNALKHNSLYLKALLLRAKCYNNLKKIEECVGDYKAALKIQKTAEIEKLLSDAMSKLNKSNSGGHYHILGVSKNATPDEIKRAYHQKARLHHPDKHANARPNVRKMEEQKFKEISKAYEILSDAQKKSEYDREQDKPERQDDFSNARNFRDDDDFPFRW